MILRVLLPALGVAGILGWTLWFVIQEASRKDRQKRQRQYSEWVGTIPDMPEAERGIAQNHVLRIIREGPKGACRGPWENVP
jgi:hypothetical protein